MKRTVVVSLLVLVSLDAPSAASQSASSLSVGGRVSQTTMIAPGGTSGGNTTAHFNQQSPDRLYVRLLSALDSSSERISVQLLLRTNTSYLLEGLLVSGSHPLNVTVGTIRPTGPLVVQGAMQGLQRLDSASELTASGLALVEGTRISVGTPSSSRNALEVEVRLEPQGAGGTWSAEVLFTIRAT